MMNSSIARLSVPGLVRGTLLALLGMGLVACEEEPGIEFQHGSVKLEFRRGDGVTESPFAGTSVMQVTLNYEACLIDFYKENPNWQQNGPDGGTVFGTREDGGEGWRDELCDRGNVGCEVIEFTQQLDDAQGNHLKVLYSITDDVENRTLHFGPVPLASLANCDAGGTGATVRVASNGAVIGLDGVPPDGNRLWADPEVRPVARRR